MKSDKPPLPQPPFSHYSLKRQPNHSSPKEKTRAIRFQDANTSQSNLQKGTNAFVPD